MTENNIPPLVDFAVDFIAAIEAQYVETATGEELAARRATFPPLFVDLHLAACAGDGHAVAGLADIIISKVQELPLVRPEGIKTDG